MRRFIVQHELLRQSSGRLDGELSRHIAAVLRLKPGASLLLTDGKGHEAAATIKTIEKEGVVVELQPFYSVPEGDGTLSLTLCQGLPKGEKMDLILQKATELGVSRIVPFNAGRSIARLESERLAKRLPRWERIVQEAARQSDRSTVPSLGFYGSLRELLQGEDSGVKLLLWEDEKKRSLRETVEKMAKPVSVSIIIGPEGGLTPEEVAQAEGAGYLPVTLGSRILRTETAGLAVAAILQYVWGDLG